MFSRGSHISGTSVEVDDARRAGPGTLSSRRYHLRSASRAPPRVQRWDLPWLDHASVFLGLSRQAGVCVAPLSSSTPGGPLALRAHAALAEDELLESLAAEGLLGPSTGAADSAAQQPAAVTSKRLVGHRLTIRAELEEPWAGVRPLHPCVRPECGCMGVFYTCFGGGSSEMRVTIGVENEHSDRPVEPLVRERFAAVPPHVDFWYNGCGQPSVASEGEPTKVLRSLFDAEAGAWRVWIRPQRTTNVHLAQVRAVWDRCAVVLSGGFEVRTKPHDWLLLQRLPADWDAAAVTKFMATVAPTAKAAEQVIVVNPRTASAPSTTAAEPAVARPADAELSHAFVRFDNRSGAHAFVQAHRMWLVATRTAGASAARAVLVSFLAGLARQVTEDPSLASVPVPIPSLACPVFAETDRRAAAAVASDAESAAAGRSSPLSTTTSVTATETSSSITRAPKRGRSDDEEGELLDEDSDNESDSDSDSDLRAEVASLLGLRIVRPVRVDKLSLPAKRLREAASTADTASIADTFASMPDSISGMRPRLPLRHVPDWSAPTFHHAASSSDGDDDDDDNNMHCRLLAPLGDLSRMLSLDAFDAADPHWVLDDLDNNDWAAVPNGLLSRGASLGVLSNLDDDLDAAAMTATALAGIERVASARSLNSLCV